MGSSTLSMTIFRTLSGLRKVANNGEGGEVSGAAAVCVEGGGKRDGLKCR